MADAGTVLTGALLVGLGGFFGGMARFWVSMQIARRLGEAFPWGTLVVNASGALLVGLLAGAAAGQGGAFESELVRDIAIIGFLGGYTTVSSFSLQTLGLAMDGKTSEAILNVTGSAILCLLAVSIGFFAALRLAV